MSLTDKKAFHIEEVQPSIDNGRFPIKRVLGQPVEVRADIYRDGHDVIGVDLIWRCEPDNEWQRTEMVREGNDRWMGTFVPDRAGSFIYAIEAWTNEFATWRHGFEQKRKANVATDLDALEGASLLTHAVSGCKQTTAKIARACQAFLETGQPEILLADELALAMISGQQREDLTRSAALRLTVERHRAGYSSWYTMVPRSQSTKPGRHGTWDDCIRRVPDIQAMGFDVVYLTPIHPIGSTNRKGPNNSLEASESDPGSFYAIGSADGGHDAIHPELGSLSDFRNFVSACKDSGMEVALDFAVQCSPDHPWLKQHPDWFKRRPDGTIKYAENPPKKYEDIVNVDFGSKDAEGLQLALRDVLLFWVSQGVKIFRVDNPHTKPFHFWEWLIDEVQKRDHDVIFLAEAFTRPKVMKGLAKLGFTQSYTYFTWRTERWEIEQYVNELAGYPEREFYRPNFFVSTPDILPFHLQSGEPWIFKTRIALAATLSSNYGIYNGFEILEHEPVSGREEYLNSEKYELKSRDWDKLGNIKPYITEINRIRRENPALQQTSAIRFLPVEDNSVIAYVKYSSDQRNTVVVVVALTEQFHEFWLPLGDVQLRVGNGDLKPVIALENLKSGPTSPLAYGGVRLWIDPVHDPVLLFRCLG